jgi:membrane protease YdiL (CAAX protease family)
VAQAVESYRTLILAWLVIAVSLILPAGAIYLFDPDARRKFSRQNLEAAWNGIDVIVAFLSYFWWFAIFETVLRRTMLPDHWGPISKQLLVPVLVLPATVATIVLYFGQFKGVNPSQLGLTTSRVRIDLSKAYVAWLVLTPLVFVFYAAVVSCYWLLTHKLPEHHELEKVLEEAPGAMNWFLAVLQAVILAPITEELLFRSILQRWLNQNPERSLIAFAAAAVFAMLAMDSEGLGPVIFVLAMIPGHFLLGVLLRKRPAMMAPASAVYGTSLLFAAFHSLVWPTPIPLFFLGLGLGYLAYRTESLTAPIVLHGLFNSVSCLALFLGQGAGGTVNGKSETSALRRLPAVSISTVVPACWWPLRR